MLALACMLSSEMHYPDCLHSSASFRAFFSILHHGTGDCMPLVLIILQL